MFTAAVKIASAMNIPLSKLFEKLGGKEVQKKIFL